MRQRGPLCAVASSEKRHATSLWVGRFRPCHSSSPRPARARAGARQQGAQAPPEILTPEEARALLRVPSSRAPTGIRNRALPAVLYRAGLRCAEALALETRTRLRLRGRLVFTTLDGRPLQASYVRALVSRLACKAGIDKRVHPHELRHTCAFELAGAMQRRSWTAS